MYEESASIPALSDCLLPQPHYSGADLDGKIVKVVFCVFLQLRNSARNSLTDANNNTTGFTYDGFDRLSVTTYPDTTTETYAYDANSRVVLRKPRGNSTASFAAATVPSIATPASTLTYTASTAYDALNRPAGITFGDVPAAAVPGTPVNVAFTHSYNAVNQRTGQSVTDNAWIEYPSVASTTSYTANALNQYTSVGGVTPTYDANGNLTSDGTNTYTYAAENRLVSATNSGASATYTFDGRGRRQTKTVTSGGTTVTTVYVTGADNRELLEYDGATGAIQRWYAYGLGPNDVVAEMNVPAATRSTPIPDIQGSIIGSLSNTGVLTVFAYRPFGSSAAPPATFGYTGQRYDPETGSYYYRARQYSTVLGRFMQADPIGDAGGINLYAYVENDPLNLIDPMGEVAPLVILGVAAASGLSAGIVTYAKTGDVGQAVLAASVGAAIGGIFSAGGAVGAISGVLTRRGLSEAAGNAIAVSGLSGISSVGGVAGRDFCNRSFSGADVYAGAFALGALNIQSVGLAAAGAHTIGSSTVSLGSTYSFMATRITGAELANLALTGVNKAVDALAKFSYYVFTNRVGTSSEAGSASTAQPSLVPSSTTSPPALLQDSGGSWSSGGK